MGWYLERSCNTPKGPTFKNIGIVQWLNFCSGLRWKACGLIQTICDNALACCVCKFKMHLWFLEIVVLVYVEMHIVLFKLFATIF